MKTHILKILPEYYTDIVTGRKTFEVREDDRGFKLGDLLQFRQVEEDVVYPGVWVITYMLRGGQFGIDVPYVVLGISPFHVSALSNTLKTVSIK